MITGNEIEDYLMDNYGECNHDSEAMAAAINDMSEELQYEDTFRLFLLLVENKPISELYTHSYNFNTTNGRDIINEIKNKYYEHESTS